MSLTAGQIAEAFELELVGDPDLVIERPASIQSQHAHALLWSKNAKYVPEIKTGCALIAKELSETKVEGVTYLYTEGNVRLMYSKIVDRYFSHLTLSLTNHVETFRKREDLEIGDFVHIGENVEIGSGTVIYPHTVIHNNTRIGKNCIIKSFCSIASEGLGYEMDGDTYFKFPQIGGVIMGDYCEIGPNSTIRRAALDYTTIGDGTKIGALVNIGHNCQIGKNCLIVCQGVTGGSSTIGDNVFFGINALLLNGADVGSNVTLGMGAVVVKSVPDDTVVIGNPAQPMDQFRKWSKIRKGLIKGEE